MRHTNASMRLMTGQKVGYAAAQMGHSVDMFAHRYANWMNSGRHSKVEDDKMEDFLALTSAVKHAAASGALHGFVPGVSPK